MAQDGKDIIKIGMLLIQEFLRIRKIKKLNFYNQQKFNFNKFKVKIVKRNFKFKFTLNKKKNFIA